MQIATTLLQNLWWVILESAPWLLFGFFLAGIINQLAPKHLITRYLGKKGPGSIFRAALIGAPLPLCSCGIIPSAMGVHRAGASKGATTSFLVSTPETGVDSISLTYALMGPIMAIARPIAAITSGVVSGLLVEHLTKNEDKKAQSNSSNPKASCCSKKHHHHYSHDHDDTQKHETSSSEKPLSFFQKSINNMRGSLQFGFGKLFNDIIFWLVIGLVGAALIKTFVPSDFFMQWGSGFTAMLIMIALGIPMYICATASTPLAASLMLVGISPGVALVFMLVGPATNIATLGMVRKELGSRALAGYLIGVILTAIALGSLLDFLPLEVALTMTHEHMATSLISILSAIILIVLTVVKLIPQSNVFLKPFQAHHR